MIDGLAKLYQGNIQGGSIKPISYVFKPFITPDIASKYGFESEVKPVAYSYVPGIQHSPDKKMVEDIHNILDQEGKANLDTLIKTGRLLSKNSSDNSSTLQNLYKIATEPRAQGLDNKKILSETIKTLANPFIITQNFGKIPDFMAQSILQNQNYNSVANGMGLNPSLAPHFNQTQIPGPLAAINPDDLNVTTSGTCVAASIEFNLADKKPAEFARYIAGLTSPDLSVKTRVNLDSIDSNPSDAIYKLNYQGVKYKFLDQRTAEVALSPDRNAIIRARVQDSHRQPGSRSTIDTLMQSTIMQLGSANGYNSLIDKRTGEHVPDNKGLVEYEKNFVESIIDNNNKKVSLTYQTVEPDNEGNNYLKGYNFNFATIQKHLTDSLNSGSNIIVGMTQMDENNKITGGHEVAITGSEIDSNGELHFIYNDTDDDYTGPVKISAKDLIPKIHHAGIPVQVLYAYPHTNIPAS
jgi:hypothetical protein